MAFLIGCAVVWLLGAIPRWGLWYGPHPYYRAQVHALLQGRFALSHDPGGLALDLAWVDGGVQQVWGLGVPLWLALWELIGRVVHLTPFPDRIAMLFGAVAMFYALLRAWLGPGGDRSAASRGAFLFTALAPAVVTMLRGYIGVYEEAAAYAYGATMLLLAGVLAMIRRPSTGRYVLLVAFAGATGLVRPTVWFYGTATAVVATVLYVRHRGALRCALGPVALATGLFLAGGGALYATNAARFGAGGEFGHRLNLEDVPGNLHATRFDYPFRTAPLAVAAGDLAGAMFGRPELAEHRAYYDPRIHAGQAQIARFREYYFTTYTWPYLPLALAGLVCAVIAWLRAGRSAAEAAHPSASGALRTVPDLDRETRWLGVWAVLGAGPLVVFYLRSPSLSSRYLLDLAPAVIVLLVSAWRYAAAWLADRRFAGVAFAGLAVWWAVSALGFRVRRAWQPPVGATAAIASMRRFTEPRPAVPMVPSGAYDRADPWLDLYLVGEWRCRCYADPTGRAVCDHRDLPFGTDLERFAAERPRLVEHRSVSAPVCAAALPVDTCPLAGADPRSLAELDDELAPAVEARSTPPVLYGNGTHWDLDTGRVGVSTYLFADDPAYVEVEVSRADGGPAGAGGAPAVRAKVGLEELPLRAMASTARGVRLWFAGPATPRYRRGLQVIFLAFGPPARLGEPVSDYVLWRVGWRERREDER